jgi:hypothetical protein
MSIYENDVKVDLENEEEDCVNFKIGIIFHIRKWGRN